MSTLHGEAIPPEDVDRFLKALNAQYIPAGMQQQEIILSNCRMVYAGFPTLWRGPIIEQQPGRLLFGCGTENPFCEKRDPGNCLEKMKRALCAVPQIEPDELEEFSDCAGVLIKWDQATIVAMNDPLGTHTVAYGCSGDTIILSNRPSFVARCSPRTALNPNAVFEFLLLGHVLGDKTFFTNISVLPPGGYLTIREKKVAVGRYCRFEDVTIEQHLSFEQAVVQLTDRLHRLLDVNNRNYGTLDCFLSGGWDSRLCAALLALRHQLGTLWTTDQLSKYREVEMAGLVAKQLGAMHRFISPDFLSYASEFCRHALLVDFQTDTGPWVMSLLNAVPSGTPLVDGYLIDVVLRGDRHVPPALQECVQTGDRETAAHLYSTVFLTKGGPLDNEKGGGSTWQPLLKKSFWDEQSHILVQTVMQEFAQLKPGTDFVTSFVIKNRQRRSISLLPLNLMGSRGPVFLPFSNWDLVRWSLSIPLRYKCGGELQRMVLQRIMPGFGDLVSTNSPKEVLQPFRRTNTSLDYMRKMVNGALLCIHFLRLGSVLPPVLLQGNGAFARLNLLAHPYNLARFLFIGKIQNILEET